MYSDTSLAKARARQSTGLNTVRAESLGTRQSPRLLVVNHLGKESIAHIKAYRVAAGG